MGQFKFKDVKRQEGKERQESYNKLTVKEKIAKLDVKLGKGVGAKKQRARLAKEIEVKNGKK